MSPQELSSALESIIYAADEPVSLDQLSKAVEHEKHEVRASLDLLVASYQTDEHGIEIRKVASGWKLYTKPQHHDVVRKFIKNLRPPVRLTMPALETLAVIAYKQPVTGPEINEIRGVNCGGVLKTLLEKRLISTAGRKPVIGRPILYRTSKDFLMRFGLSDLDELPSLKEFEQLAQAALGTDDGIAPIEPEDDSADGQGGVEAGAQPVTEAEATTEAAEPASAAADTPASLDSTAEIPAASKTAAAAAGSTASGTASDAGTSSASGDETVPGAGGD
jgi:segregation and condensation protein B